VVKNLVSPFQAWADSHSDRIPRALPWAFCFCFGPFGAAEKRNTKTRERGSDIIDSQDFAGHADLRTTLTYIRSRDRLSKSPA